jgi:hypothetical protein
MLIFDVSSIDGEDKTFVSIRTLIRSRTPRVVSLPQSIALHRFNSKKQTSEVHGLTPEYPVTLTRRIREA